MEAAAFDELYEQVKLDGLSFSESTLARFLTAHKYDVNAAKLSLIQMLKWRTEKQLEQLELPPKAPIFTPIRGMKSIPDANVDFSPINDAAAEVADSALDYYHPYMIQSYLNMYKSHGGNCWHKHDKSGRPVYIERIGLHKPDELALAESDVASNYHILGQEFMERVLLPDANIGREGNDEIDKLTVIMDCSGMGLHQIHLQALQMVKSISEMDQAYYPERLARLYVVNAPWMFTTLWNIVRLWMDEQMLSKVHIFGSDFKQELLKEISEENLPEFLGGTCKCAHLPGGCVPLPHEEYARTRKTPSLLGPT